MRHHSRIGAALFLATALAQPLLASEAPASFLITGAQLADGSGGPLRAASLRVSGDRIVAIGDLEPQPGEQQIDARGLVLAPG
ncbi:MAG: D-aminoacylase, partial [Gammaproteobacteria bacterium]